MIAIAVKMLLGDKAKYFGLIFGVTFATLLMAQQVSIFIGLMSRTASAIFAVSEADIWVMDQRVRYIEEVEPMRDLELARVRSVEGVLWAVPFYKGLTNIRMVDGMTQQVQLIGVDSASLVGLCRKAVLGNPGSIRDPQTAMIDAAGYKFIWPKQPLKLGHYVELNDHRLLINAICDVEPNFFTSPILYTTYQKAVSMLPPQRNVLPFILVKVKPGEDVQKVKRRIAGQTSLQANTSDEFAWRSINYILARTGIPINFSITIILGAIIGAAVTAQTFYMFVMENLCHFAAMKAVGFTNGQLFRLVLSQAVIVGIIGYGFGIGFTALFFALTAHLPAFKEFRLLWQVMGGSFVLISLIILASIVVSLRRVFKVDPALVFKA
jgi:putative ABC transport system permease protein